VVFPFELSQTTGQKAIRNYEKAIRPNLMDADVVVAKNTKMWREVKWH